MGLVVGASASLGTNLNYTCGVLDDLSGGDKSFTIRSQESCSFSFSVANGLLDNDLPLDVIFKGTHIPPDLTFMEILSGIDVDHNIENGVIITAASLHSLSKDDSEETQEQSQQIPQPATTSNRVPAPGSLVSGKTFYGEIGGDLYRIQFDEGLKHLEIYKMTVHDKKATPSSERYAFDVTYAEGDTLRIGTEVLTIVKRNKGRVRLVSHTTNQVIKLMPRLSKGIQVYQRRHKKGKVTRVAFFNHVNRLPDVVVKTSPTPAVKEKPDIKRGPVTTPKPAVTEKPAVEEEPAVEKPAIKREPLTQEEPAPVENTETTERDDLLTQEQNSAVDTETGKIQNFNTRMGRMVQEYQLVLNLVSRQITCESADSGAWNNPGTWKNGNVPSQGARVLIHKNHRVIINRQLDAHIQTIKLEGELAFNPHKNTRLYVDTIVTLPGSVLRIGEPIVPIDADKKAEIIISDYNEEGMIIDDPASPDYDPLRIGQGILTNGLFLAYGADKTPYAALSGEGVARGATELYLDEAPEGWRVGDRIVINGVSENGTESELRSIVDIEDTKIILDAALAFDHIVPETTIDDVELKVHVANLSRNAIIKTDADVLADKGGKNNPQNVEHRGHVLFMHNNNVNIHDVEFRDLGRTNKKYPLDETLFTSEAPNARATKIGTNQAARYPVHFHRAGLDGKVGRVNECVIVYSPGWGYVNHSSNVIMKDNIAYGVYGASFITEAGDENGVFEGNMAIATRGLGAGDIKSWKSREKVDDWGFQGNGFWLLGKNVDIVNNIVTGSSNTAFALAHKTIDDVTGVVDSDTQSETSVKQVALKSFVGNIAYGNSNGVFGILSGTRNSGTVEVISGLLAYANRGMGGNDELLSWWYPDDIVLDNVVLIGDIHDPKHTGIGTQTKLRKTTIQNCKIEGLKVGLRIPEYYGVNIVENLYLNNLINMYYRAGMANKGANTRIGGKIVYGTLPDVAKQVKIKFDLNVRDVSWKNYWRRQYNAFSIIYAPEGETPMKLYMTREQSPDFVVKVGTQKGKSNAQLIQEGHKPVGGELLPEDAVEMEGMENVSGVAVR
jgi:hypothetical protein